MISIFNMVMVHWYVSGLIGLDFGKSAPDTKTWEWINGYKVLEVDQDFG